ncbi:MAG: hypothetical protein ACTSO7_00635 [Candidatus Heimdallarchaeota archaeon]
MNSVISKEEKDSTKIDEIILDEKQETLEQEDQPEIVTRDIKRRGYTLEIASGSILGALSALIGLLWDYTLESYGWGPAFAPGMTWLDILAVPILVAFFIFGIRSGLIAAIIGCSAIIFFPGEKGLGWLSMWPKFFATTTMFIVPWLLLRVISKRNSQNRFFKKFAYSSDAFQNVGVYAFVMSIAVICRVLLMLILNSILFGPAFFYLNHFTTTFEFIFGSKELFVKYFSLGGWYALWNIVQGISDSVIAYSLIFPTKLHKTFKGW